MWGESKAGVAVGSYSAFNAFANSGKKRPPIHLNSVGLMAWKAVVHQGKDLFKNVQ